MSAGNRDAKFTSAFDGIFADEADVTATAAVLTGQDAT